MTLPKPKISTNFLRTNQNFSLAPKGQEENIEVGKCNFYTDRKAGAKANFIVHTYSVGNLESTLNKMILPEGGNIAELRGKGVSVHYLINDDGTIYQLVPDDKKPWAAGLGQIKSNSKLNPTIDGDMKNSMNDNCISVMLINNGKTPPSGTQIESLLSLTEHVMESHNIPATQIIGLADWAVGRHIAPGIYFPWDEMAKVIPGMYYPNDKVQAKLKSKAENKSILSWDKEPSDADVTNLKEALDKFGISSDNLQSSALSFNLHHLGAWMQEDNTLKNAYDTLLWDDASNPEARAILGEWTENSQMVLDAYLGADL